MESLRQPASFWSGDVNMKCRIAPETHKKCLAAFSNSVGLSGAPAASRRKSGEPRGSTDAGRVMVVCEPASFRQGRGRPEGRSTVGVAEISHAGVSSQGTGELGSHQPADIEELPYLELQPQHGPVESTTPSLGVVSWIKQLLTSMQGGNDMVASSLSAWASRIGVSGPPEIEQTKWRRRLVPAWVHAGQLEPLPEHLLEGMRLVDCLQRLGISHLFKEEIDQFMHFFYSQYQVNPGGGAGTLEDTATAFLLLRQHGFHVSQDVFNRFRKPDGALVSQEDSLRDLLSFYRASQRAFPGEDLLEEGRLQATKLLQQKFARNECEGKPRDYSKEIWYNTPRRSEIRHFIEEFINQQYSWTNRWSASFVNEALHELAKINFNKEQANYRACLEQLQMWEVETRLDKLQYSQRKCLLPTFFGVYAAVQSLTSVAFMAYIKLSVLIVMLDDYFDLRVDPLSESYKLVEAFKRWDPSVVEQGSEVQKTLFEAIYQTINTISKAAYHFQGRDVGPQIRAAWTPLLDAFLTEAEWMQNKYVPSTEEYLEVSTISLGLDPIMLSAMFLMDENLADHAIASAEFKHLMHLVNRIARLQNDIQTYKREMDAGKLNSLTIQMMENREESIQDVQRQLLSMAFADVKEVVREVYSHQHEIHQAGVPPNCLLVVLDTALCCCFFYQSDDEMAGLKARKLSLVKSLLSDPIR